MPIIKLPYFGEKRIIWFRVFLTLILSFDIIWTFSLLSQTPPRDGGELFLIRIFENILSYGLPLVQLGPDIFDVYPRSILFNYLMAGWKVIAGNDIALLRLIPLAFYYLSACLVYHILGGRLIGIAGLLTMLASKLRISLTVCKPWTFYEAMFLAMILLFKRAYVDGKEDRERVRSWLTPERAEKILIWALALSALVYESAGLAALLVGMLGLVYLGRGFFKEKLLIGALVFSVCWIVTTSYLLWQFPLFDLQGFGGAQAMFSPEKYPSMFLALWNGEFLQGIVPVMISGFFKVAPFGLVFILLTAVFLVSRKNPLSLEYRYYSTVLILMLCQVVLYFVLMKNRRWDMVESGRYIFQFYAVWVVFIWLTIKFLSERIRENWKRSVRIGLVALMGLGVTVTLIGEGRFKPFFEHNFHDYAGPVKLLSKNLKPGDRLYHIGGFSTLRSYLPNWTSLDLVSVGNPPFKNQEFKGSGPYGRPLRGEDYFNRVRIIEGLPWLSDLVGAVQSGRCVWILQDVWPLRNRLEDYSPELYYLEFQKDLYKLRAYPELNEQVRIWDWGQTLALPPVGLGGTVLTLDVNLNRDKPIEVMTQALLPDQEQPIFKRIALQPGPNRIVLFYYRLPTRLIFKSMEGGEPSVQIKNVEIEGLGSGLRTVLQSSTLGRMVDSILPFEYLHSLALILVKGREGRAALEERRRYPDKAPDTVLIFKVQPPFG